MSVNPADIIREVGVDPAHMNIDDFERISVLTIKYWLSFVRDDIKKALNARFSECFQKEPLADIPEHYREFCPDSARKYLVNFLKYGRKIKFFWSMIYLSTRYNVSCHELLFGTRYKLDLFGRTKNFVGLAANLSDLTVQATLRKCLEENHLNTNSPLYVFKQRCLEICAARGTPIFRANATGFGSPLQARLISIIFDKEISHREEDYTEDELVDCTPGFDLLFRYCLKFSVSADYLILQDYSDFATMNGEPLTPEQKEWLSIYLCATPDAQEHAIRILSRYLIDQADARMHAQ